MKESLTIIYTLILKYLKGAHIYITRNRKYIIVFPRYSEKNLIGFYRIASDIK